MAINFSQTFFSTSDLNLATIASLSYPLDRIERLSDRKMAFVFKRDNGLDQLIEAFWQRETRVEPLKFSEQRKMLLARLGNEEGSGF
jgi:hypothetical protein